MNNENYLVIQGWMRNELNLKGNELMVYALIYGFSQDGEDEFTGSVGYIADWIGATRQTVFNTLKLLVAKDLIKKEETFCNGVKFCKYSVLPLVKKFDGEVVKNFDKGSKNFLHNNISDNKTIKNLVSAYNDICTRLKRKSRITKATITHVTARLKEYEENELEDAFVKMNASDFLAGDNDRHWQADFDWLMKNENNVAKVLDGKYDNALPRAERELIDAYNHIGGEDIAEPYDSF